MPRNAIQRRSVYKYFSSAGEVYINISPAPEKFLIPDTYQISASNLPAWEVIIAGEVFIYTPIQYYKNDV